MNRTNHIGSMHLGYKLGFESLAREVILISLGLVLAIRLVENLLFHDEDLTLALKSMNRF